MPDINQLMDQSVAALNQLTTEGELLLRTLEGAERLATAAEASTTASHAAFAENADLLKQKIRTAFTVISELQEAESASLDSLQELVQSLETALDSQSEAVSERLTSLSEHLAEADSATTQTFDSATAALASLVQETALRREALSSALEASSTLTQAFEEGAQQMLQVFEQNQQNALTQIDSFRDHLTGQFAELAQRAAHAASLCTERLQAFDGTLTQVFSHSLSAIESKLLQDLSGYLNQGVSALLSATDTILSFIDGGVGQAIDVASQILSKIDTLLSLIEPITDVIGLVKSLV